jgi:CheY-like chemotaxis protein
VLEEMAPYQGGPRVTAIGPSVTVSPNDAQTLALALHELATNAAKYGALSAEGGRVDISWSLFEKKLALTWKESGGPPVEKPRSQGFGTKIMLAGFSDARRSKVSFDWNPAGLCCVLELRMVSGSEDQPENERPAPVEKKPAVTRRLLVVEDEPLIGVLMEDVLHGIGFDNVELCRSLEDGFTAVRRLDFAGAILDMNLNGVPVYPLADLLIANGVPLIFVTGYSRDMVDGRFANVPLLEKPVDGERLAQALKGFFQPAPPNLQRIGAQRRSMA